MKKMLKLFLSDELGAVTVDWVVLTAAIIGLGLVVIVPIATGSESLSTDISGDLGSIPVGYGSASY